MATAGEETYPFPLGVTVNDGGVNVAIYSSVAWQVQFCTFDDAGRETARTLDQVDSDIWHGAFADIKPGDQYGFRVSGPYDPSNGTRCNPAKLLLDPYAKTVTGNLSWRPSWNGAGPGSADQPDTTDSAPDAPRSVVTASSFDWGTDAPLDYPLTDTVIYELHVRGFTRNHTAVPPSDRGTFAALSDPAIVEYLQQLGVTAVELLPVHQSITDGSLAGKGLANYWGYNTIGYFAPHAAYSAARSGGGAPGSEIDEFKATVKTLHAAGIEVILDVVFNHTAEGDQNGPTLSFRGIDNAAYYQLVPGHQQSYDNLSGCGNTIDIASPPVRRLILDCLRYWVTEYHVDGFRFDLATVLGRDWPGTAQDADPGWDSHAAFFDLLLQDPTLAKTKFIAEPWDQAGDLQTQFPPRWSEWNGQFRDVSRDYWRAQLPVRRWFAARLAGSPDMYCNNAPRNGVRRQPGASINFVTCHDGFTLADLVAYDTKHNLPNGENNNDGTNDNRSWNCGPDPSADGPTTDAGISALRKRQQRNILATLLIARGVPMLQAGDERGRTQLGNNNAYCQDNATSWLDWTDSADTAALTAFTRTLIALRNSAPVLRAARFPAPAQPCKPSEPTANTGVQWFDPDGMAMTQAGWGQPNSFPFTVLLQDTPPNPSVLVMFNAGWQDVSFTLPPSPTTTWTVAIDTTDTGAGAVARAGAVTSPITVRARSLIVATS